MGVSFRSTFRRGIFYLSRDGSYCLFTRRSVSEKACHQFNFLSAFSLFATDKQVVVSPLLLVTGPTLEPAPAPGKSADLISWNLPLTPPALGNGSSQNDPIIFSDDAAKSFGSADLPSMEDMDMMMVTTINRYRDEPQHNNKLPDPTHDMLGAAVVLSNLTAVGCSTPRHSNQQRRTRTSCTIVQHDSVSDSSKRLF
jgi:hypothetical protein